MTPEQQKQLDDLAKKFQALSDEFYRGNFASSQDFQKYTRMNGRFKVTHYDTLPTVCEVGEVAESAGKLRVCSAANTWTIVGAQS